MELSIKKAVRGAKKARILLAGPSGSGKTLSALLIASGLADGAPVLMIDTEQGSASLYADYADFDVMELPNAEAITYVNALKKAASLKYGTIIIDSASHLWQQILDMSKKMPGNSFANWGKLGALYDEFVKAMLAYPGHVVVTTRAKTKFEQVDKKVVPMGLDPIMRDGFEYEVDIFGMIDIDHNMSIRKTRIRDLADRIITKPGKEFGEYVAKWLESGAPPAQKIETPPQALERQLTPEEEADAKVAELEEQKEKAQPLKASPVLQPYLTPPEDKVIETNCRYEGQKIKDIHALDPKWIPSVLADEKKKARLLDADRYAMESFMREKQ